MLLFEQGVEAEAEGQLDRLAGGPGRRDDHHPAPRMDRVAVSVGIGRERVVAVGKHAGM